MRFLLALSSYHGIDIGKRIFVPLAKNKDLLRNGFGGEAIL